MNSVIAALLAVVFSIQTGSFNTEINPAYSTACDSKFRAAKYSILVNLGETNEMMSYGNGDPASEPSRVTVFHYYIQYGDDRIIYILEPESNMGFMGTFVIDWNYSDRIRKTTLYLEHVQKYSVSSDSIRFLDTVSTGETVSLCPDVSHSSPCDSVKYTSYSGDLEATVCFNSSIPNIPFNLLLYPDIEYLPVKVYGWENNDSPAILEKYIVGQTKVDSLLSLFTFEGFIDISDDPYDGPNSIGREEVEELIRAFDKSIKDHD